jgi:integrase
MATNFVKGWSEPCHGGRIRKTVEGKFVAEVSDRGTTRRAIFATKQEARSHIAKLKADRNQHGDVVLALTATQTRDALEAFRILTEAGIKDDLRTVAADYAKRNRRDHSAITVEKAIELHFHELENPKDGGNPARHYTVTTKRRKLDTFAKLHGKRPITSIQAEDVEAWIEGLGDVAPRTRLNHRVDLQSLFNWLEGAVLGFENTVAKVKQRKRQAEPAAILTPGEAKKLLRVMEDNHSGRFVATLALMLFAGIRPYELLRAEKGGEKPLTWENVRLEEGMIILPTTGSKTRSFRTVPISDNLREWLEAYPGESGRIAPSEDSFQEARKLCADKAGLTNWTPDICRHSFATYAGELHGLHIAAGWMGHSGTLSTFQAHYRGLTNAKDARAFFSIKPAKAGDVVQFEGKRA